MSSSVTIGLVSIVLAVGLAITASPVFSTFYSIYSNEGYKAITTVLDGIDKALSPLGIKNPLNPSRLVMMLLVSSGATLFAAGLEAFAAFYLCARGSVSCYSVSSLICLVACVGSALASMQYFNMLKSYWSTIGKEIQYWQYATVINAGFLLFAWLQTTYCACSNRPQYSVGRGGIKCVASINV